MKLTVLVALIGCAVLPGAAWASSPLERDVIEEINRVRAHPHDYADELRAYRTWFDGRVVHRPEDRDGVGVETFEGVAAVDDAIMFLDRQVPLPPLGQSELLASAARDHADEQAESGAIGHTSPDGRSPGDRVKARGGDIYVGETISYGAATAIDVVRQLIIDDGVPRRGHRALIFSPGYHYAGAGCGPHLRYGAMCVVDYAATPDGSPVLPTARH